MSTSAFSAAPAALEFPHKELPKIEGKPSYLSIQQLKAKLIANAVAIHSSRGNGLLGHVVLVIGEDDYNTRANPAGGNANDWVTPVYPGNVPNVPANGTAAQINHITATWQSDTKEFNLYNAVETSLKRLLLAAVDDSYVSSLSDNDFGFANVTTRQILQHLETTYGALDADALSANLELLKEPWEPAETMEPLWKRTREIQAVAAAGGEAISDGQLLISTRAVLKASGVFDLDLREWDKKPVAQRTWVRFKEFFTEANTERVKNLTAGQLQHRAFGATASRPGTPGSPSARFSPITIDSGNGDANVQLSYCWTHGLTTNAEHNSKTCTRKAKGHQEDATLDNMLGGNNTIRRKRGERNIFKEKNPPGDRQPRNSRPGAANNASANEHEDATVATANTSADSGRE